MRWRTRPAAALIGLFALLGASVATSATAAPSVPDRPGPLQSAGKGDSDGDKIADDLAAALAATAPDDLVEVIVQGASPADAHRAAPSLQVEHEFKLIEAFSGTLRAGQVRGLAAIPTLTRIELNGVSEALDLAGDRDYGVVAAREATGLAADGTLDGDGVGICVIDTGIDPNHEQLSGRIDGWKDYVNNRATAYDDHGHGTHVSGIAAGDGTGANATSADNYGGVARAARLYGAKVLSSSGSGADANVALAVEWCASHSGVNVISMSLGSPPGDGGDAVSQAVNQAVTGAGKVVVVAAGNEGDGTGTIATPGVATYATTVGAASDYSVPAFQSGHDRGLWIAGFSSRGPTANAAAPHKPDVVAPGVSVLAAKSGSTSTYVAYSGTSMATPFVSGVVALGLDAVPGATPAQIKAALQASARDAGTPGRDDDWGYGLVDARAFIDALKGTSPLTSTAGPSHALLGGTVPTGGSRTVPIEVTTAGQPLGVSVRIDGEFACTAWLFGVCWSGGFTPDLDVELIDPSGVVVQRSECPLQTTTGPCGSWGRWETLGVAAAAAGTWSVRVYAFDGGPGGAFEADVFGALDGTTPPPPTENLPPVANAGPDQTVKVRQSFTLSGAGSGDPENEALTYAWYLGNKLVSTNVTFTTKQGKRGTFDYRLVVTDPHGAWDDDFVRVSVT